MLADCVAQAPLNPESMSMNLAQAVLLMAWEWRMATLADSEQLADGPGGVSAPADLEKRAYFMLRLQDVLEREGEDAHQSLEGDVHRRLQLDLEEEGFHLLPRGVVEVRDLEG